MSRNWETDAVVLVRKPMGDLHRSLQVLTPDRGLLWVVAHGAGKNNSRIKPFSQPFTGVHLKLYHDPVRDSHKIVEIFPRYQTVDLASDLHRVLWANLWSEVIIKTQAGGEDERLFYLLDQSLPLMANFPHPDRLGLQVLWRFHQYLGWGPDLDLPNLADGPLGYSLVEGSIGETYRDESGSIPISKGAVAFLSHTLELDLKEAVRVSAEKSVVSSLKSWLFQSLEYHLELRLKSLHLAGNWFY